MGRILICVLILTMDLALSCQTQAQEMVNLHIDPSPTSRIEIAPYDSNNALTFARVFGEFPAIAPFQPFSVVILNKANNDVVAVGLKWTIKDADGKEHEYPSYTYIYLSPRSASLARPGKKLLAAPNVFISESTAQASGMIGLVPDKRTMEPWSHASEVGVKIDCIIFADGEIVGPDTIGVAQDIQDRKIAAAIVAKRVRESRSQGKDLRQALLDLDTESTSAWGTRARRYQRHFARSLLQTRYVDAVLNSLEKIPNPPKFYRKDGEQN